MLEEILKLHQDGQFDEAERQYREFLAFTPDQPEALHLLAILRRQQGDLREALELAQRAVEIDPERSNYQHTLGGLWLHARQFAQAREHFSQALRLDPNQFGAALGVAQVALLQGDFEGAREAIDKAERMAPEHPQVLLLRANLLQARGDHERAVKLYIEAAKRDPDEPAIQASLARSFTALGQTSFAEQALRNAVRLKPDYEIARVALGQLLLKTNQPDEALAEFEAVLEGRPDHPLALAARGDIRRGRGDREAALDDYRKAHEVAPDIAGITASLIEGLLVAGDADAARKLLSEALSRQPQALELRRVDLAIAIRDGGDRYLAACRDWVAAAPGHPEALERLLTTLELRGEFTEMDDLAREALNRDSRLVFPRLALARSALRAGDAEAAQEQLTRLPEAALSPARRNERAQLRGLARDSLGDHAGAVEAWLANHRGQSGLAPLVKLPDPDKATSAATTSDTDAGTPAPCFLVGLPGAGCESVNALLRRLGVTVLGDRFGQRMRADALATGEFVAMADKLDEEPDLIERFRDGYLAGIAAADQVLGPELVDWLPFMDTRMARVIHAAFPNARFIFVARDPRDCLLTWLALGTPQALALTEPTEAGTWLARAQMHLRASLAPCRDGSLLRVDTSELDQPQTLAERVVTFLGLSRPDPMPPLDGLRLGRGGLPTTLPDGRWQAYAGVLEHAFELLSEPT